MNEGLNQLLRAQFGIESEQEMETVLADPEALLAMLDVAEDATQHPHNAITLTPSR